MSNHLDPHRASLPAHPSLRDSHCCYAANTFTLCAFTQRYSLFGRLVNAPAIEAAEVVEKLGSRDAKLGLALTSLRKLIRVSSIHEA